jgi:hypothetical protein
MYVCISREKEKEKIKRKLKAARDDKKVSERG